MYKICRITLLTLFAALVLSFGTKITVIAATTEKIPQVAIVSLDHSPFIEGDKNEFYISSKGYSGNVQYQLFYTCDSTMSGQWQLINSEGMSDGWTYSSDSKEPVKVDISGLNLKANDYRFAIRVRRTGVKGKYANQYGDYDNAYPFVLNVGKSSNITLDGGLSINKTEFTKGETINISGVEGAESNLNYRLHLYDVANDRWLTNLTSYGKSINLNTSGIPEGKYILDMWVKADSSTKNYDGWKLKTIEIKKEWIPEVSLVSLEHYPFVEGDNNEFFIASNNYTGQVQYQLFYTSAAQMGDKWQLFSAEGMKDGWTQAVDASEPLKVSLGSLNLKADFYRFAIRVRRAGVKGKYSNQYGDYDFAYPFNVDVIKSSTILLAGNIVMDKADYLKNEQLVINGVEGSAGSMQYKLHLYDIKNNIWITNLTDYSSSVDFDLTYVPAGKYIVDMWGKDQASAKSYDGWKLAVITVDKDLKKVIDISNISDTAALNSAYTLPRYVKVKFEDGSVSEKPVIWNGTAGTGRLGNYSFEGTVAGYDGKVLLSLYVYDNRGNTAGNTVNGGFAIESNGWVYYTNFYETGSLYKVKTDGTGTVKVTDDIALNLNIIGDVIYYSNYSDNGNIYKIKTDGTDRTKIGWDASDIITVVNDWIYYINAADSNRIYKIKTDGSARKMISSDNSANLNVVDNYVYYTNIDDGKLYRCGIDGLGRIKISDDKAMFVNVVSGYIYYTNASDNYYIYKIDINGKNRTRIISKQAAFLNVYSGKIYYSDISSNFDLYCVNTDGTNNSIMLQNAVCVLMNISSDKLYYMTSNDNGRLYSINLNGSEWKPFGLRILSLQESQISIKKGDILAAPAKVTATLNDNTTSDVDVQWDTSSFDVNTPGEYVVSGTVQGFDGQAVLKITVTE